MRLPELPESQPATRDRQGADREPAERRRQEDHSPVQRPARAAAAWGGRVTSRSALARRPCAARGQGAGAVGMDLGQRVENIGEVATSWPLPTAAIGRRTRSCTCGRKFVFRRVAADSTKIELGADAGGKLHLNLLQAMGFEIASIHAAGAAKRHSAEGRLEKAPAAAGSTPPPPRLQPRLSSATIGSGETDAMR